MLKGILPWEAVSRLGARQPALYAPGFPANSYSGHQASGLFSGFSGCEGDRQGIIVNDATTFNTRNKYSNIQSPEIILV